MPKIVIWMPHDENQPGHVAIATNEYYVSFWPANCLEKDGKHIGSISDSALFVMQVHGGCLVFHQDLDKEYEGDCDPLEYQIDAAKVSNEDVNAEIEEFLRYNEINPEDVTLAKGEEKYRAYKQLEKCREYRQLVASLSQEEAERIEDLPVKLLAKTKYSIVTKLVSSKKDADSAPFYNSHQSCVSFAFNLIQMAWLKCHPDQPIPIVNYEEVKNASEIPNMYYGITLGANLFLTATKPKELPYKVPWFEKEVVRRYLITDKINNQPIISAQLKIDQEIRQVKPILFLYFVLLLIGYFFPNTAYPNVFIYWNSVGPEDQVIADDPSILRYFIFPLFIILFAHNFSCGVVLSVVIFHVFDFLDDIMESYLSGKFWGSRNHILVEILSVVKRVFEESIEHSRVVLGREPESSFELLRVVINYRRAN